MKPNRFHPDAWEGMVATAEYYERERPGLGEEFLSAVGQRLRELEDIDVLSSPVRDAGTDEPLSRLRMSRFPHVIIMLEEADRRVVVAVAHVRRKPGYWLRRLR